jgi:competence protein ComEC
VRIEAVAALDPAGEVAVTAPAAAGWRATSWLRARSRAVANARLDPDRAAIVTGLLTGDVRGQTPERRDQLAAAGLTHLVVVSGRHVGLALAGVLGLAVLLGAGARGRRVAALVALVGYATLVR